MYILIHMYIYLYVYVTHTRFYMCIYIFTILSILISIRLLSHMIYPYALVERKTLHLAAVFHHQTPCLEDPVYTKPFLFFSDLCLCPKRVEKIDPKEHPSLRLSCTELMSGHATKIHFH